MGGGETDGDMAGGVAVAVAIRCRAPHHFVRAAAFNVWAVQAAGRTSFKSRMLRVCISLGRGVFPEAAHEAFSFSLCH